jgi:predicted O-methyltransferase YrrM
VYQLTEEVIYNYNQFYAYKTIEALRAELLKDETTIRVLDLGAGSQFGNTKKKRIRDIAHNAAKPPKFGKLIFRLCDFFQPETILELGTSLGLTTAYMAAAKPSTNIYTLEGCPETLEKAKTNFNSLKLKNIHPIQGDFGYTLPSLLKKLEGVDFAFFDGNHRYKPTMDYFTQTLRLANENSLFIFDDIHWSSEMEQAWEEIKKHPQVSITIDLFFIGLVFFRKGKPKEHFVIRF